MKAASIMKLRHFSCGQVTEGGGGTGGDGSIVVKCEVIIMQILTFKPQNHIIQCTQKLQECAKNFKSLAPLQEKIESFKVQYSPILNSLISLWFQVRGFSMKQFELQKFIS